MGMVTGYTAAKMEELADENIVSRAVVGDDLILTKRDTTTINAGDVRGPVGPAGTAFTICTSSTRPTGGALFDGLAIYETDTKRIYVYNGTTAAWVYRGGTFICTNATRPSSPFAGLQIYETDTKRPYIYDGTAWVYTGGVTICTSGTRPSSPFEGLEIYETDTDRAYVYNGSDWRFVNHLANENKLEIAFTCGAANATTSGTMTDWISLGSGTVPSWATKARVVISLTGIYDVTTANHTYGLRLVIGTDAGNQINDQGKGVAVRFGVSWITTITLTSTGSKTFKIQAARLGGANTWATDGSCHVNALVEFLP